MTTPTDEELTQFGIRFEDDLARPFDPAEPSWNESIFYDWYNADGTCAGHIRIGALPNQGRVWLWLFVYDQGQWVALEEPRLPIGSFGWDSFSYEGAGLSFSRTVDDPLRQSQVRCRGFGRVVSGPRTGRVVPVSIDLAVTGTGPAHTVGDAGVSGHSSDEYDARRFEQPTEVRGSIEIDGRHVDFEGRGERDHSWGPRFWNMEWTFLVLNGEAFRMQCVRAQFDEDTYMDVGYLNRGGNTQHVELAEFDLTFDHDSLDAPYQGTVRAQTEAGTVISGRIENVAQSEIDLTHSLEPPQASVYRRGVLRFTPDDGGPSCLGWLEYHRFLSGWPDV